MSQLEVPEVGGDVTERKNDDKKNTERIMVSAFMHPGCLADFIEVYRNAPCLWQINSADYHNRVKRDAALNELLEYTKQFVPNATIPFIKKRIEIIRGCFRKELAKIVTSRKSGAAAESVYTPKLWYFDLLSFLSSQDGPLKSSLATVPPNETTDECDEEEGQLTNINSSLENDVELESNNEDRPKRPASTLASERNKRTRKGEEAQGEYMINTALKVLEKPEDEFDLVGKMVATKLRKMIGIQKVYAEKLIHDVLYKGLLEQLSESSFIGDYHPPSYPLNRVPSNMSNASSSSNDRHNHFGPINYPDIDHQ